MNIERLFMTNEIFIPPKTINNEPTWGEYTIKLCNEKLYDKYTKSRASYFYDLYIAKNTINPDWRLTISETDCIMTNYVNSRISLEAIDNIFSNITKIETVLKEVDNLHIADILDLNEEHFSIIGCLFKELMVTGIRISIASKILHMKFPSFLPILDSYVMSALFRKNNSPQLNYWEGEEDKAILALKAFRYIYIQNITNLDDIKTSINRTFNDDKSYPHLANLNLSNIRILENLIWFDWGGWENFEGWHYLNSVIVKKVMGN